MSALEPKIVASGQKSFDPRARLVSVLGDQLIRDETVGILELVKNSYDADASLVQVRLVGTKRLDTTQVVVLDDGCGMSRETVLGRWFEPATGEKEQEKNSGIRSARFKRLPLGEKGVGRFAAHRLGRRLLLISRVEQSPTEIVVTLDWDSFEEREKYLREVSVDWQERDPVYFPGDKHGTYMLMSHARSLWSESEVRSLSANLKRLMSPFAAPQDFKVTLDCPDYPQYQDLRSSDLLDRSHADFYCTVDESGELDFEYKFKLPGFPERESQGRNDLRKLAKGWSDPNRKPACGHSTPDFTYGTGQLVCSN